MAIILQDLLIDSDLGSFSNRQPIKCMDSALTSLPAFPAPSLTADSQSLHLGDRVLFTALSNPAENNMIYKVVAAAIPGNDPNRIELSLVLDSSGRNPSGAPMTGDFCRVQLGSQANNLMGWNGDAWVNVSFSAL